MKKYWIMMGAILLGSALCLGGCGSSDGSAKYSEPGYDNYVPAAETTYDESFSVERSGETEGEQAPVVEEGQATAASRKLIRTVNLTVETQEYDEMMRVLDERVKTMEGYVENMSSYNDGGYWNGRVYESVARHATLTIRVPQSRLEEFLADLNQMGHVTSRSENTEDVTLTYVDIESRKIALETEQARLLALLEQAETVEDIITIESRLSQVRYEIGSMVSQLRTYDNKVDYATVYIDVSEVKVLTPVEEPGTWERITSGFMRSVEDVAYGLREFGIGLIVALPHLILWGIVILIIVLIVRHFVKKSAKKRAALAGSNPYYRGPAEPGPGVNAGMQAGQMGSGPLAPGHSELRYPEPDRTPANHQSQNGDGHGTNK